MLYQIQAILNSKEIPNEIKVRTKNIYGIYKRITNGDKLADIHDSLSFVPKKEWIEKAQTTHAKRRRCNCDR